MKISHNKESANDSGQTILRFLLVKFFHCDFLVFTEKVALTENMLCIRLFMNNIDHFTCCKFKKKVCPEPKSYNLGPTY